MLAPKREFIFGTFFLDSYCEKNKGGTRNLILRGNELIQTIGRRVTNTDLVRITQYLRENKDIVSLELPYNEISDCGMSTLVENILDLNTIKHLNLIGNNITVRGITYLTELHEYIYLYSLRLSGNKIEDAGGKLMATILRENIPLKFLDLSDTHQTMTGLAHILTALMPSRGGNDTLQYIDLGRPLPQPFHQLNHEHASEFVSQMLADNTSLKEVHLQQFHFDFRDMEIMLDGLEANYTLVCLDLNNNQIGDEGVHYLCKYLEKSPKLECLMIGANLVGDHGALSLSRALPYSKIKLLDLTNNLITDDGMINIFYTIQKEEPMKCLFIWGNKLTHTSLIVLQRLFTTNVLHPERTDIRLYYSDGQLHASWNYHANRYTKRFYCVADFASLFKREFVLNPQPPEEKPDIYYKYHTENKDIGFPMCEWD